MSILYAGGDLAKNVFAVHEVNEAGNPFRAFRSPGEGSVALWFILTPTGCCVAAVASLIRFR